MKTKLKDNVIFRAIIIPISIILCFVGQFIPSVNGLSSDAFGVIFIFIGVLLLWLTIGIDWPSLLCLFALGFIDKFGFNKVLSSSFGNSTFAFLLFTFVCTYALSKTSLIKRIALTFVNFKISQKNSYLFIFFFLLATLILGLFISPSVLFVILLPILNEIISLLNIEKDDKISKVLMLGLGFTVSISSGMTPIAHVFPILAINAANIEVSTFEYIAIAFPAGLVLFLLTYLVLILCIRPKKDGLNFENVANLKKSLQKLDKKDIITLIIFISVLVLWIVPSIFEFFYYPIYEFFNKYGTIMPPLLGTILLCVIRVEEKPLLEVGDAFKNGVPWASLIMCAATLALGEAIKSEDIGLITYLQTNLGNSLVSLSPIILLIIFALWAAIQTNLSSNMVTATLVGTVASTVIASTFSTLNLEATICIIGMLSSFAFATPPSMPHIAIISSSETLSTKEVFIYGLIIMLLSVLVALLISYPIGLLIF